MKSKTFKFREYLVPLVLSGEKDVTWRINDERNLKSGDIVPLINWNTDKVFGKAKILDIKEKKAGEISDKDFDGHEKFSSREEMLKTYRTYYGDWVNDETTIRMFKFKLLK